MPKRFFCVIPLVVLFLILTAPRGEGLSFQYSNLRFQLDSKIKLLPGLQGVAFKDFQTHEMFYINNNLLFPSASVIKLPIMAAVYCEAAAGKLNLNRSLTLKSYYKLGGSGVLKHSYPGSRYTIRELVDLMISKSDNTATYMLIHKIGLWKIRRYLRTFNLRRTFLGDETLLAEKPGGWRNLTTPEDTLKLLDLIYRGKIANRKYCAEMINIMKNQKYTWGIPKKLPADVTVANKTGFQTGVLNDAGIIFTQKGDYALVVFVSNINNMHLERNIINNISCRVYEAFMKRHGLYTTYKDRI